MGILVAVMGIIVAVMGIIVPMMGIIVPVMGIVVPVMGISRMGIGFHRRSTGTAIGPRVGHGREGHVEAGEDDGAGKTPGGRREQEPGQGKDEGATASFHGRFQGQATQRAQADREHLNRFMLPDHRGGIRSGLTSLQIGLEQRRSPVQARRLQGFLLFRGIRGSRSPAAPKRKLQAGKPAPGGKSCRLVESQLASSHFFSSCSIE